MKSHRSCQAQLRLLTVTFSQVCPYGACYWLQVKWASYEESERSVFGHALGFERSITLFILNIKVSGLFTQLRALFSGRECQFPLKPFCSYNSVFTEQESKERLKRKAASAHRQRSHAGLFIAFVSSVHSAMCVVFLMSFSGVWRDSGSPWHVAFPEIQKTCGS